MGVEVCPVHKAEFKKSSYIPFIHVGAMSNHSQPGGLKRKRPDDEDEDEDPPAAPTSTRRQPPCSTNKVRQEILDLTYQKLERYRATPNSGLSRYVLMINTARTLEQELQKDGIKIGPSNTTFIAPSANQVPFDPTRPPPPDDSKSNFSPEGDQGTTTAVGYPNHSSYSMDTTDSKAATTSVINTSEAASPVDIFGGLGSSTVTYSSEYDRYLMDIDGPSSGRATPFVRSDVESCALWNEDSDRLTSLNWSSVLNLSSVDGGGSAIAASSSYYSETTAESSVLSCNFDASSNSSSGCSSDCSASDDAMSSSETSLHTLMPVTTGIPAGINPVNSASSSSSPRANSASSGSQTSGSSPPNSEDEIFGDIDLALYDYDFTPLSPPNVRMAPVSAEELMQSLSSSDQRIDSLGEHLTPVRT